MKNSKQPVHTGRLIIVAYRLPFKLIKENDQVQLFQNSGGLVSAVLSLVKDQKEPTFSAAERIQWIGFSENTPEELEGQSMENDDSRPIRFLFLMKSMRITTKDFAIT
jgi:trehalose 6-phosphate synthase/phosphatase